MGKELAIRDKITAITAIAILIPPTAYHIVTALSNGRIAWVELVHVWRENLI